MLVNLKNTVGEQKVYVRALDTREHGRHHEGVWYKTSGTSASTISFISASCPYLDSYSTMIYNLYSGATSINEKVVITIILLPPNMEECVGWEHDQKSLWAFSHFPHSQPNPLHLHQLHIKTTSDLADWPFLGLFLL